MRAGSSGKQRPPTHWWENTKAVLVTLAFFLVFRTFLLEAYRIPSGSMIPTLLIGDWLFVNKLAYGPHVPFTEINLPGYAEPRRGDVIVFKSPTQVDQPEDPNPTLVKRCVAIAGDTVYMRGSLLHINGVPQPQDAAMAANPKGDGTFSHRCSSGRNSTKCAEHALATRRRNPRWMTGGPWSCRPATCSCSATTGTIPRMVGTGDWSHAKTCVDGPSSCTTRIAPARVIVRSRSSPTSGGDASERSSGNAATFPVVAGAVRCLNPEETCERCQDPPDEGQPRAVFSRSPD